MASKNGQITFNCGLVVPADKAEEVEEVLSIHEGWMRETHSLDADGKIHLVDYYVTKSEQLKNPLDPSEGTTGNILYSINETDVEKDGLDQHMQQCMQFEHFPKIAESFLGYGKAFVVMGGTVIHSM